MLWLLVTGCASPVSARQPAPPTDRGQSSWPYAGTSVVLRLCLELQGRDCTPIKAAIPPCFSWDDPARASFSFAALPPRGEQNRETKSRKIVLVEELAETGTGFRTRAPPSCRRAAR